MAFGAWALGFVHLCKGDLGRAVESGTLGVEKAPTPAKRAWAQGSLAAAWCRAGQVDRAIEVLAPLCETLRGGGFVPGEALGALFLGEAYWRAGRYDEARAAIEQGLEIHVRHGMKYEAAVSRRLLAEVLAATARPGPPTMRPSDACWKYSGAAADRGGRRSRARASRLWTTLRPPGPIRGGARTSSRSATYLRAAGHAWRAGEAQRRPGCFERGLKLHERIHATIWRRLSHCLAGAGGQEGLNATGTPLLNAPGTWEEFRSSGNLTSKGWAIISSFWPVGGEQP